MSSVCLEVPLLRGVFCNGGHWDKALMVVGSGNVKSVVSIDMMVGFDQANSRVIAAMSTMCGPLAFFGLL
jgi:hypothetical protein